MTWFRTFKQAMAALPILAIVILASNVTAKADPISVCTGVGCSTTNVTGTIVAGNGTVTITLNNNLTNAQVVSVIQNVSGVYFQVSGYNGGAVSLSGSNATQSTNIDGTGNAVLAGAVNPTGWAAGNSGSTITVCVIVRLGLVLPPVPIRQLSVARGAVYTPTPTGVLLVITRTIRFSLALIHLPWSYLALLSIQRSVM